MKVKAMFLNTAESGNVVIGSFAYLVLIASVGAVALMTLPAVA